MIAAGPPRAISQGNEEFLAIRQRAKYDAFAVAGQRAEQCASELRLIQANGEPALAAMKEVERKFARALANIALMVQGFLVGENSIENVWRDLCANATTCVDGLPKYLVCKLFENHLNFLHSMLELLRTLDEDGLPTRARIDEAIQRTEEFRDRILGRWPLTSKEFAHAFPVDVDELVYISPSAFLRSILAVVWNAFRHPFSTTYIDLSTGDSMTPVASMDESES